MKLFLTLICLLNVVDIVTTIILRDRGYVDYNIIVNYNIYVWLVLKVVFLIVFIYLIITLRVCRDLKLTLLFYTTYIYALVSINNTLILINKQDYQTLVVLRYSYVIALVSMIIHSLIILLKKCIKF